MKIHVYSTLARLVVRKIRKKTQTQYTTPEQYKHTMTRRPGCPALRTGMGGYLHLTYQHFHPHPDSTPPLVGDSSWDVLECSTVAESSAKLRPFLQGCYRVLFPVLQHCRGHAHCYDGSLGWWEEGGAESSWEQWAEEWG